MSDEQEPGQASTAVVVRWFGELGLQAEPADGNELASAISDFIRNHHRLDRSYLLVSPKAGAMFSVQLGPLTIDRAVLTARIPPGPAGRRATLASIGWAMERASSGTRYYTRHFDQPDLATREVVHVIVEAYQLLYGERAKELRWHVSVMPMHAEAQVKAQWQVRVAGTSHRIAVGIGSRTFSVDGVEHRLGGRFHRGPRTAVFYLGGLDASITSTRLAPTMRAQLWRRITRGGRGGPLRAILVSIRLSPAAGAGAMAASHVPWLVWGWTVYELRVGDASHGSWVYTNGGERGWSGWVFVPPGGALPQRDWINWPVLPAPTEREISRSQLALMLPLVALLLFFAFMFGVIYFRGS